MLAALIRRNEHHDERRHPVGPLLTRAVLPGVLLGFLERLRNRWCCGPSLKLLVKLINLDVIACEGQGVEQ